jgi:hypothetical protein
VTSVSLSLFLEGAGAGSAGLGAGAARLGLGQAAASQILSPTTTNATAVLRDSYAGYDSGGLLGAASARFFVASKIDGKTIPNAVGARKHLERDRGGAGSSAVREIQ